MLARNTRNKSVRIGNVILNPGETKEVYEDFNIEGVEKIGYPTKKDELMQLPMSELRKIGYKYNCRDTSKKELVEEILKAMGD